MRSIRVASCVSMIAIAGALGVIANAQEQAAPASGIFVQAVAGSEVKLPSARFEIKETGVGKSMLSMGLTKPQMHGELSGAKAETRVAGDAAFRIQFDQKSAGDPQSMSPTDMMAMMNGGDGSIPAMAKGPQDFALVKLAVSNENREASFGTPGATRAKDAVDFSVEKLGAGVYRVKPKHALPPGEYAFYVRMGNAPMGQAWDFGVDQK